MYSFKLRVSTVKPVQVKALPLSLPLPGNAVEERFSMRTLMLSGLGKGCGSCRSK
jgi:hypothetical protein